MVQLLLETGALCERDTFQGERCLYNALTDRIRNLLLSYDYSKSTDPLQPLASHVTSLLVKDQPRTSDITVTSSDITFSLHKFILAARSPYFEKKLSHAPDTISWKLPVAIPPQSFAIAIRYVYLGEIPSDLGGGPGTGFTEEEILKGVDKISKQLEIRSLWAGILEIGNRRLARQRRTDELERGRQQLETWFRSNVLRHKINIESSKANEISWDRINSIFADVLLRADEFSEEEDSGFNPDETHSLRTRTTAGSPASIPVGPVTSGDIPDCRTQFSTLYPVHRAMLLRSEFFQAMFASSFREAQETPHLHIISINCTPDVLEVILTFLYTERAEFPLESAVDVLYAADLLFLDKLKQKAAQIISTLGNGSKSPWPSKTDATTMVDEIAEEFDSSPLDPINVYDVLRAGWATRVPRLEEFGARYFADRLEKYIDEEEFADIIKESASRIQKRQETDSIELLDDIRYYLSERFRLRFEDSGIEDMMTEEEAIIHNPATPRNSNNDGDTDTKDDADVDADANATDLDAAKLSNHNPSLISAPQQQQPEDEGIDMTPSQNQNESNIWDPTLPTASGAPAGSTAPADPTVTADSKPDLELERQMPTMPTDGVVYTLSGEIAGDEFAADAYNYQLLLGKIDALLERLKLDA